MKKQNQSIKEKESMNNEMEKIKKIMSVPIKPTATSLHWFNHKGLF